MGQFTHHRLDRLQIVSVGSLRDQSTTQFHRWRSKNKILSCEVITRMLLGRIIRGHSCGGHHVLICVPLNGIQVKTSLVIDSPSISSRRGHSSDDIVDTKTIWFVFLLILPCWRVFFLGSPALHNAGTDRLQMVGVRSLHVDSLRLLVRSSDVVSIILPPTTLEGCQDCDQILCSTLFFQSISESCNKKMELWIKFILLCCFIPYIVSSATSREEAGRRKKNKELREP